MRSSLGELGRTSIWLSTDSIPAIPLTALAASLLSVGREAEPLRTRVLPWKPKVIQSKTLKLVRPPSLFCTSLAMRRVSSCDQVGPGAGFWAITACAVTLKMRAAARRGNVRRVGWVRVFMGPLRKRKKFDSRATNTRCRWVSRASAVGWWHVCSRWDLQPFQRLVVLAVMAMTPIEVEVIDDTESQGRRVDGAGCSNGGVPVLKLHIPFDCQIVG